MGRGVDGSLPAGHARPHLKRAAAAAAVARGGAVTLAAAFALSCARPSVRIEVSPGEEGTMRTFAGTRLAEEDIARLESIYGDAGRRERGSLAFSGRFAEGLPEEIGNRNGLSEVRTSLGSAWMYWESLDEPRDLWSDLTQRQAAGELWARIFARWAETLLGDDSQRERFRSVFEAEYLPLARDAMLLFGAMQATSQAQRVAAGVRGPREAGPITPDERFRQTVFLPLLLLLGERGFFTPVEMQRLTLLSMDGAASEVQRQWSLDEIILPAIARQIRRFRPDAPAVSYPQLLAWGISFALYANSPARHADLLLASPAVPDEDKAKLRAGEAGVSMPTAFGVRVRAKRPSTDVEVVVTTGVEPHLTNGSFDPESGTVRFRTRAFAPGDRVSLFPPAFHASWAVPDEAMQRRCFGELLLQGAALAEFCGWQQSLPPRAQQRLEEALQELAETGRPASLRRIIDQLESRSPAPAALARWVRDQATA